MHPTTELPEPGVIARAVLPQARPIAADGDLHFDKSLAGLVDGADPGDRAGIVAGGVRGVDHAVHSAWRADRGPGVARQHDQLLRRSVCAAGQAACSQVKGRIRLSASDRKFPRLTGRSGTQRARRLLSRMPPDISAHWPSSPPSELRITRVFSCVARGLKPRASFRFTDCCWWRPLAVDGSSGTSRGHAWKTPVMRGPGIPVPGRTLQGMARVRSGQAPAWPLVSDRSVRRGSRVKRDIACTLAGAFPPVLVALRAQSRLGLEGRTRTLSGPSSDLTSSVSVLVRCSLREPLRSHQCLFLILQRAAKPSDQALSLIAQVSICQHKISNSGNERIQAAIAGAYAHEPIVVL